MQYVWYLRVNASEGGRQSVDWHDEKEKSLSYVCDHTGRVRCSLSRATLHWKWKIGSETVQVEHRRNHLVPPLEPYVDTEATESMHFWCTQRRTRMFVHVKGHVQSLHRDNEVLKRAWWWVLLFLSKSLSGELIPQIFAYLNKGRGDDATGNGQPNNYLWSICCTKCHICSQCVHANAICSCFI